MASYAMIALYVLCSPFPTVCWLAQNTPLPQTIAGVSFCQCVAIAFIAQKWLEQWIVNREIPAMAQSQERCNHTTQHKKLWHHQLLAEPKHLGPESQREHHVECPRNTRTRGEEIICEQSIMTEIIFLHMALKRQVAIVVDRIPSG